MRLYASADTKENIGYTVSWIGFELEDVSYVFDLQGRQNYKPSGFDIMFKGDALPWTVIRGEEEIDLTGEVFSKFDVIKSTAYGKKTAVNILLYRP